MKENGDALRAQFLAAFFRCHCERNEAISYERRFSILRDCHALLAATSKKELSIF